MGNNSGWPGEPADKPHVGPVMEQSAPETPATRSPDVDRLLQLQVPVIVKLAGKKMNVESIAGMTVGAILEFDVPAEQELELRIRDKPIGYGVAVKVGEFYGLRITSICDVRETIAALGER